MISNFLLITNNLPMGAFTGDWVAMLLEIETSIWALLTYYLSICCHYWSFLLINSLLSCNLFLSSDHLYLPLDLFILWRNHCLPINISREYSEIWFETFEIEFTSQLVYVALSFREWRRSKHPYNETNVRIL